MMDAGHGPEPWSTFARGVLSHTRLQLRVLLLRILRLNLLSVVVVMLVVPILLPSVIAALDAADVLGTANFVVEARAYPPVGVEAAAATELALWRAEPSRIAFMHNGNDPVALDVAARACGMLGVTFSETRVLPASDPPADALFDLEASNIPVRIGVVFGSAQGSQGLGGAGRNFSVYIRQDRADARGLKGSPLESLLGDNSPATEEPLLASGATLMQTVLNRATLDALAGGASVVGSVPDSWTLQRLPDAAREDVNPTRRILYPLIFLVVLGQTSVLVLAGTQEEKRERRALMLHGLRPQAFVLAHFVLGVGRGLLAAAVALTISFATGIFASSGAGFVAAGFAFFVAAQAAFNCFITAAIGRRLTAQVAMAVGLVSSIVLTGAVIAVQTILADPGAFGVPRDPSAPGVLAPLFLFPQLALGNLLWGAGAARQADAPFDATYAGVALGMLCVDVVVWLLLALAVDSLRFSSFCGGRKASALSPQDDTDFAVNVRGISRHFSVPAPDLKKDLLRAGDDDDDLAVREDMVERKLQWGERQALLMGFQPSHTLVPRSLLDDKGYLLPEKERRRMYELRHGEQERRCCGRVTLRAVDGLSLHVPRNSIFCLLGQNGSGKTTTMEMMTGALRPTAGDVWISGLPISQEPGLMRGAVGLCAQKDVVFNMLSCLELLEVCGALHGLDPAAAREEGAALLERLGIGAKAHARPMQLSGGQRRRLSVAAAVMGRPPVIILDEPTTGLDVKNRRAVWELLMELREHHTVILTTHSMEEAQALGDRIAIMADGKLQAEGTLRELRRLYGDWAHLACVRRRDVVAEDAGGDTADADVSALRARRENQADAILAAVREVVPEATVLRSAGPKVSFSLPLAARSRFPDLFELLDARKAALQLRSFAVSPSTLDDVFLRLAADLADSKRAARAERLRAAGLADDHFDGAGAAPASLSSSSDANKLRDAPPAASDEVKVPVAPRSARHKSAALEPMELRPRARRQARALAGQVLRMTLRRPASAISAVAVPVLYGVIGGVLIFLLNLSAAAPQTGPVSLSKTLDRFASALPVPFSADDEAAARALLGADLAGAFVPDPGVLNATGSLFAMGGLQFRSPVVSPVPSPVPALDVGIVYNQFGVSAGNALLQAVTSRVAQSAGLDADIRCTFETWRQPFAAGPAAANGVHMAGISLAIVSSTAAVEMARHRATHVKDMLLNTGMSQTVYWATNGAAHALLALFSMTLVLLILLAFQAEGLRNGGFPLAVLMLLLQTPASTASAYCLSLPFKTAEGVEQLMAWIMLLPFFLGYSLSAFVFTDEPNLAFDNAITVLAPSFGLFRGLVVLQAAGFNGAPLSFADGFVWDELFAQVLLFSALSLVFWSALLVLFGFERAPLLRSCCGGGGPRVGNAPEAETGAATAAQSMGLDVETADDAEQERLLEEENARHVMAGTLPPPLPAFPPRSSYGSERELPLRVHHMSKSFGDFQALRDVTLGTARGSITGLLGPNGSGKSTLVNCITRYEGFGPDAGDAFVANKSVRNEMPAVRRVLGLCPQFDALVEVLTPRELLRDMCDIRGVPTSRVDLLVGRFLRDLGLTPKADARCGTLSGGNKRRLSIAQAMIASPSVLLLDEPSTGQDSVSRRVIWDFLLDSTYGGHHSCVLATHSMEEADALCQRLVVMVAGSIRAAGSAEQLKTRYGDGIVVRLEMAQEAGAREAAETAVRALRSDGEAQLLRSHRGVFQYVVKSEGLSWAHVFETLQENPDVEDFTVAQRSLEDVFVQLASLQ